MNVPVNGSCTRDRRSPKSSVQLKLKRHLKNHDPRCMAVYRIMIASCAGPRHLALAIRAIFFWISFVHDILENIQDSTYCSPSFEFQIPTSNHSRGFSHFDVVHEYEYPDQTFFLLLVVYQEYTFPLRGKSLHTQCRPSLVDISRSVGERSCGP